MSGDVARVAELLGQRNRIDEKIAEIIQRPMAGGHLGEWITARVFNIELEPSASRAAIDGRFRTGALQGKSVNIKWYLKREGLLDMTTAGSLDYYLVLTGPAGVAGSSRASSRPWRIDRVYLFDAEQLCADQRARGVQAGTAASVPRRWWDAAEIYPRASNPLLYVSERQAAMLELFQPG
ncbi:MAG: hypothetical protein GEV12_15745 [Micromonosporaceae bacterium]|nr:hypothetical protein [Micromonosporaceae bacterium]